MTTLLSLPSFSSFFWKAKGLPSPSFCFVLLQQQQQEGDGNFAAVAFFLWFFLEGKEAVIPFFLFCFVAARRRKR